MFSANLGFLWRDLPFLQRIARAADAGFEAVEFHDGAQLADPIALDERLHGCALAVVSLNTAMGGTMGAAALPGEEARARAEFDRALEAASLIGARRVHVTAGIAEGVEARASYLANLRYALERSAEDGHTILIEPVSPSAIPGYFLNDLDQALAIRDDVGDDRLKILFDCFHVQAIHGDVEARFRAHVDAIGHVQIASFPDRAEPGVEPPLDYRRLLPMMREAGYAGRFGAEYRPGGTVEEGLGWREAITIAE